MMRIMVIKLASMPSNVQKKQNRAICYLERMDLNPCFWLDFREIRTISQWTSVRPKCPVFNLRDSKKSLYGDFYGVDFGVNSRKQSEVAKR
jgi:hypothetical protein